MPYILGLDLGPNSIGWACIDNNDNRAIDMGVRIFQEGVNREKGNESSKNEVRRLKRQSRRQYGRAIQRRENLVSVLKRNAMYPDTAEGEKEFFSLNPYELRKRALDEKLSLHEIGRALFHINQRRGFKSSRKRPGDAKEDSRLYAETGELEAEFRAAGCRTFGEYLAGLNPMEQRIRDRYTLRKWYEEEFDEIWKTQSGHHAELTGPLKDEIRDRIIFYQRPLKSVARFIGNCSLEPVCPVKFTDRKGTEHTILKGEKRCRKDSFEFQRFRIFEQINRLKYIGEDGERSFFKRKDEKGKVEEFDDETRTLRNKLIAELEKYVECKAEYKYDKAKKLLKLPASARFNLEGKDETTIIGDRTSAEFAKAFDKKRWSSMTAEQREKVYQVYIFASDEEWLSRYAKKNWGLDDNRVNKLLSVNLESGYAAYSKKAILKLLPFLECGFTLSDAKDMAYGTGKKSSHGKNPLEDFRNPIVAQTLYELLRFLPKLEKVHGKPESIRVELARELKVSAEKRLKMTNDNSKRKAENERVRGKLIEYNIKPNHDAVERYRLWEECKGECPYTGKSISIDALFRDNEFHVEHILPLSRSLNDSFMNKTLCHAGANKLKGNRTPYEAFGGTPEWDGILMRIERFQCPKRERFTMKEIPDDFISRQLNDTAYISREAKNLLEGMDYKVSVSMGRATAQLRRLWGLHNVLGGAAPRVDGSGGGGVKNREDHRHHAIDAVVVALTDAQTLHKLSLCYEQGKTPTGWSFPAPWDNFRSDVERLAGRILVSHRVNKRVRGQLHEEQYYGYTGRVNDKKTPLYAVRKKLEDLTPAMLKRIRDREVQKIIIDALTSSNVPLDDKKSIKNYFKDKENHTVFMKCGKGLNIPINKVRIDVPAGNMIQLPGRNKTFVEPGNNHHAVFYRYTDKNGKPRYDAEVCTLFEAVKRLKKGEAVIRRRLAEGKEFLFSLSINELLLFIGDGSDGKPIPIDLKNREQTSRILYRVQKISDAIVFRRHDHALIDDKNKDMFKRVAIKKVSNDAAAGKILKVRIDRLGRLDRAND